ncbi:MAG: isochorismate synthase [Bacteroidales bacterium]|nr:isochorismate synthase [Bacteroidales bacterium]
MREQHSDHILDLLIEQEASFAIFRPPYETVPRFVMQTSGSPLLLTDIEELNGQHGYVIAPFRVTTASPIIVIRPDLTSSPEAGLSFRKDLQEKPDFQSHKSIDKIEYGHLFNRFHRPLSSDELKKLVLCRTKTIGRKEKFSPGASFFSAVKKYPHSYIYLFHTPQSGTWLGSTPELLLTGAKEEWHTVALAGTRYPHSDKVTWDDKNLREQHLVTSYLLKQLSSFHITPEINGPYTVKSGNLAHLKTDFNFNLPEMIKPGTLLKALHPTPAVSGLPKEEAYQFILDNEEQNRLYYSGFLGLLNTQEETDIYVNLRCMHIEKKSLTLFAGSGLLASSSMEEEWEETGHKLEVMLHIME